MDTGLGRFAEINEELAKAIEEGEKKLEPTSHLPSVFRVGEILEIKNSRFQIVALGKTQMRLKLLKKQETPQ